MNKFIQYISRLIRNLFVGKPKIQKPVRHSNSKRLGPNLFYFGTNGDSFEELLVYANCVDVGRFSDFVSPKMKFHNYESNYQLLPLSREVGFNEIVFNASRSGRRSESPSLRELLEFVIEFPEEAKKWKRVPAFGLDIFNPLGGSTVPTIRYVDGHFELYKEYTTTLWGPDDRPLKREPLPKIPPVISNN